MSKPFRHTSDEVKAAILTAATALANKDGWDQVTLRKVAAAIGYTTTIIYSHFKTKKAMLHCIAEGGYEQLNGEVQRAVQSAGADPGERLIALVHAYVSFSRHYFSVYYLMHTPVLYQESSPPLNASKELLDFVCEEIAVASQQSPHSEEVTARAFQLWSSIHGLIMIEATYPVQHRTLDHDVIIEHIVRDFISKVKM